MFASLPRLFKTYDLTVDVRTLLILRKAMSKGLVKTLGDIYNVLRGLVVKSPEMMGSFMRAYYLYFLNIDIENGESLNDAILRSETFRKWRTDNLDRFGDDADIDDIVLHFLDDVHFTSYDIKEVIDGREIWDQDRGDLTDNGLEQDKGEIRPLEKMLDYSDLSLEELLARMEEVLKHQKGRHEGGSHWIGSGGVSPYGFGGAAKDGLRIGGQGGGKMARKVLIDWRYFPVDREAVLSDNNIDAALSSLKGEVEESSVERLDIQNTIKNGIKRGGLFLPELKAEQDQKLQVIIMIDNGGYSMNPYIKSVRTLFNKMKTRFAHDLETFYFHNTIYDYIYTDEQRTKAVSLERILEKDKNYKVFIIGDAAMAAYELNRISLDAYRSLTKKFSQIVWLNPEPQRYWKYTFSIQVIKEIVGMFPLSPKGIEDAVRYINKKK